MKLIPVSVAMFVRPSSEGRFDTWIQQRTGGPLAGKWEFPGGKIEQGETPWEALVREIQEETAVVIKNQGKALGIFAHDYGDKRVLLHIYQVPWENDLKNADGLVVPLQSSSNGQEWGVDLLEANFRLVEHLCRSLYDGGDDKSIP
jgi:8-oxo-dGTP diphosphatase